MSKYMSKSSSGHGRKLLRRRKKKLSASFLPPKALVIYAKINGQPDNTTRVVGSTLDEFLTNCTQILKLNSAARKLFLSDGSLVESIEDLEDHSEVFVSQGEPFIDTMKQLQETLAAREMSFWGLNGLYLPKLKPKTCNSNRDSEQANKVRRVLTFGNGDNFLSDGFEIISDLKNMEEFLSLCDSKHSFNGHCKRIFSDGGIEIVDLTALLDRESYVWNPQGPSTVLGPVWVSTRDEIDGSAIYQYFRHIIETILQLLRKEKKLLSELRAMSDGDLDNVHTSSIKSYSKKELEVRKQSSEDKVIKLEKDRDRFQTRLDGLSECSIKESGMNHRTADNNYSKGSQGLRLKVYTNGQSEEKKFNFFFNVEQARKGINNDSLLFSRLLDDLSKNSHLTKMNDHSRGILVRRLFTKEGVEIREVSSLEYDQVVCVSHGENWIDPKCFCLSGNVHFMNEDLHEHSGDLENLKDYNVAKNMQTKQRLHNLPMLQNKKKPNNYLMVSVSINEKSSNQSSLETWCFTKSGRIFLKRIPSLSLTLVTEGKTTINIPDHLSNCKEREQVSNVSCFIVQLYPHQAGNPNQLWEFTEAACLSSKAVPSLLLTYIPLTRIEPIDSFYHIISNGNLYATESLSESLSSQQRWGFKHLDQWKVCDMPNIDWHKAVLIWPLNRDGELNADLRWPLEGNLIPGAPPATKSKLFSDLRFPIKLNVLKNNDHRSDKATLVTGPDLTKLVRVHRKDKYKTHCSNESLLRQEFEMFLMICTGVMGLPSAARRLFTRDGKEITNLEGLSNHDYVCVSMGEGWCSPEKTLTKIQLRSYTNKLIIDVERLKNFVNLCQPNPELVIGIKNNLSEEDCLVEVQQLNDLSRKELQKIFNEDNKIQTPEVVKESSEDLSPKYETVHERNCDAAKLKHLRNSYGIHPVEIPEIVLTKGVKKPPEVNSTSNVQQFVYENNCLLSMSNHKFGLYANEVGKPVTLKRLTPMTESGQHKWIIHKSGIIESMYYRGFVLTVSCTKMLPFQDKSASVYNGATVTLEKAVNTKYGKSLQRFNIVPRSGLIYPFSTNKMDKSVTSAILSSICTRFVSSEAINQQGFVVEMKRPSDSESKNFPICLSCVSILNGRFPITSMDSLRQTFVCSYSGGFKVLRNVDLSPDNAAATYEFYLKKLCDTKEQLTLKPCKNRITAMPTRNIKVLLYRNGHGRIDSPQAVTAKSINQIMEMATNIFHLQRPVRILYNEMGDAIVDELSFSNIMSNSVNGGSKVASVSNHDLILPDTDLTDTDETLNVALSDDGSYFIVKLGEKSPTTLYSIEIFISNLVGISQFQKANQLANLYFLINYEIFNNQINTDLFRLDSEFESEVTELTVKSSKVAMQRLFNEELSVLRMQLISATVDGSSMNADDMRLDIKSINGFTDVSLKKLAERMANVGDGVVTETIQCALISTETFEATSATITVEVSVRLVGDKVEDKVEDFVSVESESTIIMQPNYVPGNTPIELWASTGEPFGFPCDSDTRSPRKSNLDQLKLEIYNKKFLLRTIKGERIKKLDAGTLEATGDGKNPVMIKGNWMFPSVQERELIKEIDKLEKLLTEKKAQFSSSNNAPILSGPLYNQKHMKNCLVYLNGDKENKSISAWGESIYELMNNAAGLLQMKKKPKYLFRNDGYQISNIDEISPDMRLALSHHSTFISAQDTRLQCEIKANWGRARSKYGEKSTELEIHHRPITVIDVDPFEPPEMMKPREIMSREMKTFKVFENGQPSSSAMSISGNTFSGLLKKAAEILKLAAPVKCFYTLDGMRIGNFKEILNDDILAASVTGKGFFKNDDD